MPIQNVAAVPEEHVEEFTKYYWSPDIGTEAKQHLTLSALYKVWLIKTGRNT